MQILLSPAKDMTDSPSVSLPSLTTPLFLAEAEHSAEQMSELSTEELSQLLKINSQLAALNKQRYTDFPALTPRQLCCLTQEWRIVTCELQNSRPKI